MPRYFTETSCLIGLTFAHDRWFRDVRPLLWNNTLYTSDIALYEYCNRSPGDPPELENPSTVEIQPDATDGIYGYLRDTLNRQLSDFHNEINPDTLTLNNLITTFVRHFEIRKQAVPLIRDYFIDFFDDHALTPRQAEIAGQDLVDRLLNSSQTNKQTLMKQVNIVPSRYHHMDSEKERIKRQANTYLSRYNLTERLHGEDFAVLLDAVHMAKQGGVTKMAVGDDDYLPAEQATNDLYNLSITWADNEFYSDDLVTYPKPDSPYLLQSEST